MKKGLQIAAFFCLAASRMMATTATVNLDNFYPQDANGIPLNPIYYLTVGVDPADGVWVEVLGNGTPLSPPIKADLYDLTGDGKPDAYLFQAGTGEFPSSVEGGSDVTLRVRAWVGGPTFDTANRCGSTTTWIQKSGSWDKTAQPLPLPPDVPLLMPGAISVWLPCPEPSTIALSLIGGAVILLRRRLLPNESL